MRIEEILEEKLLEQNKKNYHAFCSRVIQKEVTWVLGAGVSAPAGLPDWKKMLTGMWVRITQLEWREGNARDGAVNAYQEARKDIFPKEKGALDTYYKRVSSACLENDAGIFDDVNVLESAEYMWNYVKSFFPAKQEEEQESLAEAVLDSLIKKTLSINLQQEKLREEFQNQALEKIALILKEYKGTVITYNYDNLLEFCLAQIAGVPAEDIKVYCDRDEDFRSDPEKINIYHPHGKLNVVEEENGKESEFTVLTESSYYDLEQQLYNWQNSVQAKALMDTSCVFIGFSGDDYNFRRIIKNTGIQKNSRENGREHFIFICLDKAVEKIYKNVADDYRAKNGEECRLWDDEMFRFIRNDNRYIYDRIQFIERLHAQFNYWEKRGITAIWTTYEELPSFLEGFRR